MARLAHRDRLSLAEMAALPSQERERRASAAEIPTGQFPGFLLWLAKQRARADHVGRFARHVAAIEQARGGHFAALVPLLCQIHATGGGPAITLLDFALCEWRRAVLAQHRAADARAGRPGGAVGRRGSGGLPTSGSGAGAR